MIHQDDDHVFFKCKKCGHKMYRCRGTKASNILYHNLSEMNKCCERRARGETDERVAERVLDEIAGNDTGDLAPECWSADECGATVLSRYTLHFLPPTGFTRKYFVALALRRPGLLHHTAKIGRFTPMSVIAQSEHGSRNDDASKNDYIHELAGLQVSDDDWRSTLEAITYRNLVTVKTAVERSKKPWLDTTPPCIHPAVVEQIRCRVPDAENVIENVARSVFPRNDVDGFIHDGIAAMTNMLVGVFCIDSSFKVVSWNRSV